MKFIIEAKSGAHFGNCTLGEGKTEREAWEDAYGPKPWPSGVKKMSKVAWSRQVEDED